MRYILFSNAAVAVDTESTVPPPAPRESLPATKTIWALSTFQGRLGTYVAVRKRGEHLLVGVRADSRLTWVPAHQALSEKEAHAWSRRAGFNS